MKRLAFVAAGLLLTGCGIAAQSVQAPKYPAEFGGIPVRRIAWDANLPYVARSQYIMWQTKKPKSYRVSPRAAIARAIDTWPNLRQDATSIYIQAAGLIGGKTGNPISAYVVEFLGKDLGLNGQPTFVQPKLQFVLAIVNGSSGRATMAVGGGYPVPTPPINPLLPQRGGVAGAVKYLTQAAAAASYGGLPKTVTRTKVASGVVVSISQPWTVTAAFVQPKAGTWVGLPLDFAVNSFERETSDGSLMFLTQGPMDDGNYAPFPVQELCAPQADGTFKCQEGPKYFPLAAPDVRFGSKPNESLTGIAATARGVKFVFGNLSYADYLSVPPTSIHLNAENRTLLVDFSDTTLGTLSGLATLHSVYVQSVSVAPSGQDTVAALRLTPAAAYYTGSINAPAGPEVYFEIDFAGGPPAPPWGP